MYHHVSSVQILSRVSSGGLLNFLTDGLPVCSHSSQLRKVLMPLKILGSKADELDKVVVPGDAEEVPSKLADEDVAVAAMANKELFASPPQTTQPADTDIASESSEQDSEHQDYTRELEEQLASVEAAFARHQKENALLEHDYDLVCKARLELVLALEQLQHGQETDLVMAAASMPLKGAPPKRDPAEWEQEKGELLEVIREQKQRLAEVLPLVHQLEKEDSTELALQLAESEKRAHQLRRERDDALARISRLSSVEEEQAETVKQLGAVRGERGDLATLCDELERQLAQAKAAGEQVSNVPSHEQVVALEQQVAELQDELAKLVSERDVLEHDYDVVSRARFKAEEELHRLRSGTKPGAEEEEVSEATLESMASEVVARGVAVVPAEDVAAVTRERDELRELTTQQKQRLEEMLPQMLADDGDDPRALVAAMSDEMKELKKQNEALQRELESSTTRAARLSGVEEDQAEVVKQLGTMRAEHASLTKRCANLAAQLAKAKDDMEAVRAVAAKQKQEMEEEMRAKDATVEEWDRQLRQMEEER